MGTACFVFVAQSKDEDERKINISKISQDGGGAKNNIPWVVIINTQQHKFKCVLKVN